MEATLPTRLKVQIRDHINSAVAALPVAIAKFSSELGYPVVYDPEWPMLWTTLQPFYADQATFIPSIASVLTTFFEYFTAWLESDENEEAVESMLDELKPMGRLKLVLEIETKPNIARPVLRWRQNDKVFVIALPKARPSSSGIVHAGFATDFVGIFTSSSQIGLSEVVASTPATDDWSMLDSPEVVPVSTQRAAGGKNLTSDPPLGDESLPDLAMLERPEALMSRPPYRLVVRQEGMGRVEVQGSHQGSLILLEAYLKRWVRHSTTLVTKPPLVEIKLKESLFGLGLLYDALTIETTAQRGGIVNPSLVLVFVGNVLGYDLVKDRGVSGSVWEFERNRGFK